MLYEPVEPWRSLLNEQHVVNIVVGQITAANPNVFVRSEAAILAIDYALAVLVAQKGNSNDTSIRV